MPEREWQVGIPGTDKRIHGLLREVADAPLVVLVHGLTSHKNSLLCWRAARALEQAGYASYRFDLYGYPADARDLLDCTLQIHAHDLDLVVEALRREAPQRPVAVVGHSLGALVVLLSRERAFDAAVLWDASHPGTFEDKDDLQDEHTVWEPRLACYRQKGGCDILLSEALLRSWAMADADRLITELSAPVKLVAAGDNPVLLEYQRSYLEHATEPKTLAVVDGADHNFTTDGTMDELFAETVEWLDAHLR